MTSPAQDHEDPVDLSPLAPGLAGRADRTVERLAARIATARAAESPDASLAEAVRRRLARAALPAAVAAAAALAALLLTGRGRADGDGVFVGLLLGGDDRLAGWVAENRRPDAAELLELMEGSAP